MNCKFNKLILLLGLSLSAAAAIAQTPKGIAELSVYTGANREQMLVDGAKKEGGLTLYTSQQLADTNPIIEAFEKKYGLKVTVWRASPDAVVPRVVNEARSHHYAFDVAETEGQALEALQREQQLVAVKSPVIKTLIPQALRPHGEWIATRLLMFSLAYNTNQIKKADLPKTWDDLANPKWKGKLGIEAKDDEWFSSMMQQMGEDKGLPLFRKIVATNGLSVRRGHSLLTNLVASGEVPMALTVYNARVQQLKEKGAPIDWFVLQPALAQINGAGVSRYAPHPYSAMLFFDFLLREGQEISSKRDVISVSKAYPSPLADFPFKVIDPAKVIDEGQKWTQVYQELTNSALR
ncbi:extracellular solute-binding protein [Oxalobacteraceae bacterium CAVE-383]|nr:extracellular solute-binding protein [Oxalobacteraceae bacterium CAVE-383]